MLELRETTKAHRPGHAHNGRWTHPQFVGDARCRQHGGAIGLFEHKRRHPLLQRTEGVEAGANRAAQTAVSRGP